MVILDENLAHEDLHGASGPKNSSLGEGAPGEEAVEPQWVLNFRFAVEGVAQALVGVAGIVGE